MKRAVMGWFVAGVSLTVCIGALETEHARGAEPRLAIPKWFPAEPGAKLEYRCAAGQDQVIAVVEVREVTHASDAYAMSAMVTLRDKNSDRNSGGDAFQLDCLYQGNELTLTTHFGSVSITGALAASQPGESLKISGTSEQSEKLSGECKVISTNTKVAIDDNRWDDAIVVEAKVSMAERPDAARFKVTLASPEGVIRATLATPLRAGTMELVPPRRPFDK